MKVMKKVSVIGLLFVISVACTSGGSGPRLPASDNGASDDETQRRREEPINNIHLEISGLSEEEFREGRLFVNDWAGTADERDSEGAWKIGTADASAAESSYKGGIRISLAHPFDKKNEDYELLLAASLKTKYMGVCVADETPVCEESAAGFYKTNLIFANGKKMFFKTEYSALLEDGLILDVLAFDESKKVIERRSIKLTRTVGG